MAIDTNRIRAWLEAEQAALQKAYLDQIVFSPEMVRSEPLAKSRSNVEEKSNVATQMQQIKATRTCLLAFLADIDEAIKYIDDLKAHGHSAPCGGPQAEKRLASLPETLRDAWYEAGWDPEDLDEDDIQVGRD